MYKKAYISKYASNLTPKAKSLAASIYLLSISDVGMTKEAAISLNPARLFSVLGRAKGLSKTLQGTPRAGAFRVMKSPHVSSGAWRRLRPSDLHVAQAPINYYDALPMVGKTRVIDGMPTTHTTRKFLTDWLAQQRPGKSINDLKSSQIASIISSNVKPGARLSVNGASSAASPAINIINKVLAERGKSLEPISRSKLLRAVQNQYSFRTATPVANLGKGVALNAAAKANKVPALYNKGYELSRGTINAAVNGTVNAGKSLMAAPKVKAALSAAEKAQLLSQNGIARDISSWYKTAPTLNVGQNLDRQRISNLIKNLSVDDIAESLGKGEKAITGAAMPTVNATDKLTDAWRAVQSIQGTNPVLGAIDNTTSNVRSLTKKDIMDKLVSMGLFEEAPKKAPVDPTFRVDPSNSIRYADWVLDPRYRSAQTITGPSFTSAPPVARTPQAVSRFTRQRGRTNVADRLALAKRYKDADMWPYGIAAGTGLGTMLNYENSNSES